MSENHDIHAKWVQGSLELGEAGRVVVERGQSHPSSPFSDRETEAWGKPRLLPLAFSRVAKCLGQGEE